MNFFVFLVKCSPYSRAQRKKNLLWLNFTSRCLSGIMEGLQGTPILSPGEVVKRTFLTSVTMSAAKAGEAAFQPVGCNFLHLLVLLLLYSNRLLAVSSFRSCHGGSVPINIWPLRNLHHLNRSSA
jgi:hypothetical protein